MFYQRLFVHMQRCSNCTPGWIRKLYFKGLLNALLADHAIDLLLRDGLVRNMIKHENLLLASSFHHQLVLILVGEVYTLRVFALALFWLQPYHYLHLLLFVNSTASTHIKILFKSNLR
jgi:hypothetical protein